MPGDGRPYKRARAWFLADAERKGLVCVHCGLLPDYGPFDPTNRLAATVDHKIPTSLGGSETDISNFQVSCLSDNSSRGNGTRPKGRQTRGRGPLPDVPTSRKWL